MKPIILNWVPDMRGRKIYRVITGALVALLVWQVWTLQHNYQQLKAAQSHLAELEKKAEEQKKAVSPKIDEKEVAEKARRNALLSIDLNPLFDAIERVQIPGVVLQQMEYDQASGRVTLRYQLDSIEKAALVSDNLNGGLQSAVWQLTQVSGHVSGNVENRFSIEGSKNPLYIGVWQSKY